MNVSGVLEQVGYFVMLYTSLSKRHIKVDIHVFLCLATLLQLQRSYDVERVGRGAILMTNCQRCGTKRPWP